MSAVPTAASALRRAIPAASRSVPTPATRTVMEITRATFLEETTILEMGAPQDSFPAEVVLAPEHASKLEVVAFSGTFPAGVVLEIQRAFLLDMVALPGTFPTGVVLEFLRAEMLEEATLGAPQDSFPAEVVLVMMR